MRAMYFQGLDFDFASIDKCEASCGGSRPLVWMLVCAPLHCVYLYRGCLCGGLCNIIGDVDMYHFLGVDRGCIVR
jgi:hypothetical protein